MLAWHKAKECNTSMLSFRRFANKFQQKHALFGAELLTKRA